jgi:hypothetical protein
MLCDPALVSFAPLHSLPVLESLSIHWANQDGLSEFSDTQVVELRSMPPSLARLDIELDAELMRRLLRPRRPHALQWKGLGRVSIGVAEWALLPEMLPSLTSIRCFLDASNIVASDVAIFSRLPNLVELELTCGDSSAERILPALKQCTGFTKLTLSGSLFTSAHFSELLPCLAQLTHLTLDALPKLASLRFLSCGSIRHTLTHFTIRHCTHPDLHTTELFHVHELKELRSLAIEQSFVEPLDQFTQILYWRAYSPLLPKLTHFHYEEYENGY